MIGTYTKKIRLIQTCRSIKIQLSIISVCDIAIKRAISIHGFHQLLAISYGLFGIGIYISRVAIDKIHIRTEGQIIIITIEQI
ncbi:hypothetical protein D3C79_759490 [compost metagenome]